MRVLIASDAIGGVEAGRAAEILGRAFEEAGAQVAVVVLAPDAPRPADPGRLAAILSEGADVVDLSGLAADDLGASFLAEFDPDPSRALASLRETLDGRGLTIVVDGDEVGLPLTGLSGMAVLRSREAGEGLQEGLAADQVAVAWLERLGLADRPGAGAAQGLGALLLACGARIVDALDLAMERVDFRATAAAADLIVTGCTDLDFHARGGALVRRVVEVAEEALRPAIVVARRNFVSSRELRLAGIEAAYPLHPGTEELGVAETELEAVARKIAATWRF